MVVDSAAAFANVHGASAGADHWVVTGLLNFAVPLSASAAPTDPVTSGPASTAGELLGTHAGSSVPVQVSRTTTSPGVPCSPFRLTTNCGSPRAVDRFSPDRSTLPVPSSALSGMPGIGCASASWKATEPSVYAVRGGVRISSEV